MVLTLSDAMLLVGNLTSDESPDCPVAVKVLHNQNASEARHQFCREVKIMATFDHENIIRLIGIIPNGTLVHCWLNSPSE